jgi:nanoRNase/pAp phosphatase (c-di-AMP/oligoRNAs hydrolase)
MDTQFSFAAGQATAVEAMPSGGYVSEERDLPHSRRFLQLIAEFKRAIIVTHDNPDPDAIATGWALRELLQHKAGVATRLVGGGEIVRAENRHMVQLLQPPIELVEALEYDDETAIILVDCGVSATHHLLAGRRQWPTAVIDHHVTDDLGQVPFCDIRPSVAASATIAATYLLHEQMTPDTKLATALQYALKTETRGGETSYSELDRRMLNWLTHHADPELLAEIEDAPLSRDYYGDMVLALQSTFLYDDCAFCLLPRAQGPEVVGEVADLLIRCREINRVFCGTVVGGNVLISVRTAKDHGNATELLLATLEGIGHGGGHAHRAGGKIAGVCLGDRVPCEIAEELKSRWLAACNVKRQRGTRLIRKQEIVKNL